MGFFDIGGDLWGAISSTVNTGLNIGYSAYQSNRDFKNQEKMSTKAYQRQLEMMKNAHQWEVEDLKSAGLNPVLSAGGSGAFAGAPAMGDARTQKETKLDLLSSALLLAQINKENKEADKAGADAKLADAQSSLAYASRAGIAANSARTAQEWQDWKSANSVIPGDVREKNRELGRIPYVGPALEAIGNNSARSWDWFNRKFADWIMTPTPRTTAQAKAQIAEDAKRQQKAKEARKDNDKKASSRQGYPSTSRNRGVY